MGVISTRVASACCISEEDRKSTRLNPSHTVISYAVFCLKKKKLLKGLCLQTVLGFIRKRRVQVGLKATAHQLVHIKGRDTGLEPAQTPVLRSVHVDRHPS